MRAFWIAAFVLLFAADVDALRVVAATNDLGALAQAVGGDFVEIEVVARPDRDPHALEVRPSTMRQASRADVYLAVGLSLDAWSEDIVRGSRNRKLVMVDCSEVVEAQEVPTGKVDASQGDVHPDGNPHYWLDPRAGIAVAHHLAERFAEIDPKHAEEFRANARRFEEEIEKRLPGWEERVRGRSFVEYHRTWHYFATRFGMAIVATVEPYPGIPPSARHLVELSEIIERGSVPVVIRDVYHSESPMEMLARETDVRTRLLSSSCVRPDKEAYFELFDRAVEVLGVPREAAGGEEPR